MSSVNTDTYWYYAKGSWDGPKYYVSSLSSYVFMDAWYYYKVGTSSQLTSYSATTHFDLRPYKNGGPSSGSIWKEMSGWIIAPNQIAAGTFSDARTYNDIDGGTFASWRAPVVSDTQTNKYPTGYFLGAACMQDWKMYVNFHSVSDSVDTDYDRYTAETQSLFVYVNSRDYSYTVAPDTNSRYFILRECQWDQDAKVDIPTGRTIKAHWSNRGYPLNWEKYITDAGIDVMYIFDGNNSFQRATASGITPATYCDYSIWMAGSATGKPYFVVENHKDSAVDARA